MPTSTARTADDIADTIRTFVDRVVDARITQEMAKRGAGIGDFANEAWRDSAPMRRDAAKAATRAASDATKWSDRTWRKQLRPLLRDLWKQRTMAAGAAAAAVPVGRGLVDNAAVRVGLKRREEQHWGAFFFGLLLGAAVGAIVALLTAPKRGDEMRRELTAKAEEVRREVETKARDEWVPMFQRQPGNGHGEELTEAIEEPAAGLADAATETGSTGVETVYEGTEEATAGESVSDVLEPADHDRPT